MPAITVTKIHKDSSGRIRFRFGKSEAEFESIQAARDYVKSALTRETLELLAMAICLNRQPSLGNPPALEGKTVTVDFSLANWGTLA